MVAVCEKMFGRKKKAAAESSTPARKAKSGGDYGSFFGSGSNDPDADLEMELAKLTGLGAIPGGVAGGDIGVPDDIASLMASLDDPSTSPTAGLSDVDENDISDAELLATLAEITGQPVSPAKKSTNPSAPPVPSAPAGNGGIGNEPPPMYPSGSSSTSNSALGKSNNAASATSSSSSSSAAAVTGSSAAGIVKPIAIEGSSSSSSSEKPVDPALEGLLLQIRSAKADALTMKEAGDTTGALEMLAVAKALEAELPPGTTSPIPDASQVTRSPPSSPSIATASNGGDDDGPEPGEVVEAASTPAAPPPPKTSSSSSLSSVTSPTTPPPPTAKSTPAPLKRQQSAAEIREDVKTQLATVTERIHAYKVAALANKKAGRMDDAKLALAVSKSMAPLLARLQGGLPIDPKSIPPPPAEVPAAPGAYPPVVPPSPTEARRTTSRAPGTAKGGSVGRRTGAGALIAQESRVRINRKRDSTGDSSHFGQVLTTYTNLLTVLESQANKKLAEAKAFKEAGDNINAVRVHKDFKKMKAELQIVQDAQKAGLPLPLHHVETVEAPVRVRAFPHLTTGQLEVTIGKASGVASKPTDLVAQLHMPQIGDEVVKPVISPTVKKSTDPEFNWTHVFDTDMRKLSRKVDQRRNAARGVSITLEIAEKKGGLFGGANTVLGKAPISLQPLHSRCELEGTATLLESSGRRPTGGIVTYTVRIRSPMNGKPDQDVRKEKVLVIDGLVPKPKEGDAPAPAPAPASSSGRRSSASRKSSAASSPSAGSASAGAADGLTATSGPDEANPVDDIVSNDVLEWELNSLDKAIAGGDSSEATADRRGEVELKMQMLVMSVQTGALTMEAYVAQLKPAILAAKKRAQALNAIGNKSEAMRALQHSKIMTKEVAGVEGDS